MKLRKRGKFGRQIRALDRLIKRIADKRELGNEPSSTEEEELKILQERTGR